MAYRDKRYLKKVRVLSYQITSYIKDGKIIALNGIKIKTASPVVYLLMTKDKIKYFEDSFKKAKIYGVDVLVSGRMHKAHDEILENVSWELRSVAKSTRKIKERAEMERAEMERNSTLSFTGKHRSLERLDKKILSKLSRGKILPASLSVLNPNTGHAKKELTLDEIQQLMEKSAESKE